MERGRWIVGIGMVIYISHKGISGAKRVMINAQD
jgi:hypothetical protein